MQKKRHLRPLLIAFAAACAAQGAWAIGWGRAAQTAVLGRPLDFPVSLRLDPGDVVEPQCVSAEVTVGDARVPPPSVRVVVETPNPETLSIRVRTSSAVEEPVVSVLVGIGCPARMSRRFTVLADPPDVVPMPVQVLAATTTAPASAPAAPAASAPSSVTGLAPQASSAPGRSRPVVAPRPQRIVPADLEVAAPPRPPKPRRTAAAAPAPSPAPAASVTAAPVSRLRLDAAEPPPKAPTPEAAAVEEALQAVAMAASATRAAVAAASAAEDRIAALERQMAEMRAEQKSSAQSVGQLRSQLAEAESSARWAKPVALAAAALLALAGWLAWRLRALDAERQRAWRLAAEAQARLEQVAQPGPGTPLSQLPMVTTEIPQPPAPPAPPAFVPDADDAALDIPVARTDVLPVGSSADTSTPRDVTIEELLDLEQQAEFFIVLGQDDAAIDLLVHHLRDTGGGSPLPYLKLLEIYRRRQEREAYERTRARFNHRFNAYAPDWDEDLQDGRSLQDYPGVLPRLQQVWPRPLDAMAELEALLFRKSRGELFELPAYREVLFLYQMARDLLDRESADSGNVDLLLPLADGGEFSATSPGSYFSHRGDGDSVFDPAPAGRPTAPVDLDLTQPEMPPAVQRPSRR